MNPAACEALHQAVFEAGDAARALAARPELAAHADTCAACQTWIASFARGAEDAGGLPDFSRAVAARTTGPACTRAQELVGASFDEPPAELERTLVANHLETCAACRELATVMAEAAAALPALAEIDPGPAFANRVLAATSRRAAESRVAARWRSVWRALVARPRFALEAAYALTVVLVLVAGSPLSAWERTVSTVAPAARTGVAAGLNALDQHLDTHLTAWRDQAARVDAALPAPTRGSGWLDGLRRTWNGAIDAATVWMQGVASTIQALARRVRAWVAGVFAGQTEPPATAARSRS